MVTRFTQDGIDVKSMLVPLVEATAVPEVITLEPIALTIAPVIVGLVIVGLVKVLEVSVCVSDVPTTVPAVLPVPPAGNVIPVDPLIVVVMAVPYSYKMLIEPASKVSTPVSVVNLIRSKAPLSVTLPAQIVCLAPFAVEPTPLHVFEPKLFRVK